MSLMDLRSGTLTRGLCLCAYISVYLTLLETTLKSRQLVIVAPLATPLYQKPPVPATKLAMLPIAASPATSFLISK